RQNPRLGMGRGIC
ncbi:protein traB, partial [Escherichia coli EC1865]